METGDLSQWSRPDVPVGPNVGGGVFDSGTATATVDVASPAHSGIHSAKLYINTLNPAEISTSGVRLFRWLEPESQPELHYSVWYYFPRRYIPNGNPPWWNVFQWKSKRGDAIDPFFALNVGNRPDGSMYFYLYNQNTKTSYQQEAIKNIPDGQRSEEHTSELQSRLHLVCRLLLEKKKENDAHSHIVLDGIVITII